MRAIRDDEQERVNRFLAAFNEIDLFLREQTGLSRDIGFKEVSRTFARHHGWWSVNESVMGTFTDIRNFVVHTHRKPEFVAAVPHEESVERIERIAALLTNPERVIPRFNSSVVSFAPSDPLTELLKRVYEDDITNFPVLDGSGFYGLVTGNGLMHWMANLASVDPLTDLAEVPITAVLELEETQSNVRFTARDTPVLEAFELFREQADLEAVLITHNGREREKLLGIITVWDVTNYRQD